MFLNSPALGNSDEYTLYRALFGCTLSRFENENIHGVFRHGALEGGIYILMSAFALFRFRTPESIHFHVLRTENIYRILCFGAFPFLERGTYTILSMFVSHLSLVCNYGCSSPLYNSLNPLFCDVFAAHRCGLYKVHAVVVYKKSRCRHISVLFTSIFAI